LLDIQLFWPRDPRKSQIRWPCKKSISVGNRGRSTDPAARWSGPNSKHHSELSERAPTIATGQKIPDLEQSVARHTQHREAIFRAAECGPDRWRLSSFPPPIPGVCRPPSPPCQQDPQRRSLPAPPYRSVLDRILVAPPLPRAHLLSPSSPLSQARIPPPLASWSVPYVKICGRMWDVLL